MTAARLDGKALAATLRREFAAQVQERAARGYAPPGLAVVLVGDNPASATYVRNKQLACADAGMLSSLYHLPESTTEAELLAVVAGLNADPAVHGILVQLPLPSHIREEAVTLAVSPEKDVDCFHPANVGLVMSGQPRFYPCTPHGVVELLRRNDVALAGKHVVVVGRSNIVGKPLAVMLMQKATSANPAGCDATVTVAHTRTPDLGDVCRAADVIVAAAGRAGLITPEMVRPGAAVVDVGTNFAGGKLVGDVAPGVAGVAGFLSPVPGGVGPMTIAMLLSNTLRAAVLTEGPGAA